MIADFKDFEFLVKATSEQHAAIPVHTSKYGIMFFCGSANVFNARVFLFILALHSVVFLLIKVVFDIEFMLAISNAGPIFKLIFFFVKVFEFPFILFLVCLFG